MGSALLNIFFGLGQAPINYSALCAGVIAFGSRKCGSINHELRDKNDFPVVKACFHYVPFHDAGLGTKMGRYSHCSFVLDFYKSCAHGDGF